MSRRISLTRIIALNWYGFRQIFDVDENVSDFRRVRHRQICALDLMQYVLLGEHWRANRAAVWREARARPRGLLPWRHQPDAQRTAALPSPEWRHACRAGVHAPV